MYKSIVQENYKKNSFPLHYRTNYAKITVAYQYTKNQEEQKMFDMQDYINDGKVVREKIALDVRFRRLTGKKLKEVLDHPLVQNSFEGSDYYEKVSKKCWSSQYLDELSYTSMADNFNEDYLLYLDEVAGFVAGKESVKKFSAIFLVLAGIVACAVVCMKFFQDRD